MIIIGIICFIGCKIDETNNYITIINEFGESEYTIVRSDSIDEYIKVALKFKKSIEKLTGNAFKITTDWKNRPVADKEIIIGKTTRESVYFDINRADIADEGFDLALRSIGQRLGRRAWSFSYPPLIRI